MLNFGLNKPGSDYTTTLNDSSNLIAIISWDYLNVSLANK
jgi:hypothetical protein